MSQIIKAVFHNGTFVPQQPCNLPEGAEVELVVHRPHILPPQESDPAARKRIIKRMLDRMEQNPIPADAAHFTREELHERR